MVAIQSLFSAIAATGFASLAQAAPHTSLATRASAFQAGKINYTIKEIQDTFMPSSAALKDKCVSARSHVISTRTNLHVLGFLLVVFPHQSRKLCTCEWKSHCERRLLFRRSPVLPI